MASLLHCNYMPLFSDIFQHAAQQLRRLHPPPSATPPPKKSPRVVEPGEEGASFVTLRLWLRAEDASLTD